MFKTIIIKIKEWLLTSAGITTVICFVLGIAFIFISFFTTGFINSLFISMSASMFCIIPTVTFVQYFLKKQDEKDNKEKENEQIIKYHNYISILIDLYKVSYYELITPISTANEYDFNINKKFNIESMKDLYQHSLILRNGMIEPRIKIFLKHEKDLRDAFINLISGVNFLYNIKIKEIAEKFIKVSIMYDQRNAIESDCTTTVGTKRMKDEIMSLIELKGSEYLNLFDNGQLEHNTMITYILLYKMLIKEREIINNYLVEINNV